MEQSTLSDSTRMPAAQVETRDPGTERAVTALLTAPMDPAPPFSAAAEISLAHMVVDYFGDGEIDALLNCDIALRDRARAIVAAAAEPDPIFAAIEKDRALAAEHIRLLGISGSKPDEDPAWEPTHDASDALWAHWDGTMLNTVPTTAAGCVALARYANEWSEREGLDLSEAGPKIFDLIGRSAALPTPSASYGLPDPVFAAIEAHAAARDAFSDTVNASDRAWVAQHGGDTSDAAMAPAEAARDAASDAEDAAWDALLLTRPTTMAGVLSLIQHLGRWAPEHEGIPQGGGLQPVFAAILSGLGHALAGGEDPEAVDWHNPPPGFTPWPLIEPFGFRRILDTVEDELHRLHGIATAEYERRTRNLRKYLSEEDWQAQDRNFRESLRLSALAAAVDLDSDGAHALAALDAPCAMPAGPIEATPADTQAQAIADAIEQLWPESAALTEKDWNDNSPEAEQRCDAMYRRRKALIDAADALPAISRDARYAKGLALAWLTQVDEWSYGKPLADYTTDGRLALGIEASLTGAPAWTGEQGEPAPQTVDRTKIVDSPDLGFGDQRIAGALNRAVDPKALDIKDLSHLALWTESLMTMASGLAQRGGRRPLGRFFDRISNALCDVVVEAQDELRARTPADALEREYRLKTIALPVIENGDADELESLIADLQVEVAYLRQAPTAEAAR